MKDVYRCKYLTGRRLKVFLSVADRIILPDDSPGGGTMATAGVADWALGMLKESLRSQLLLSFLIVEVMGIFFGGRFFTRNTDAAKDRQLKWMENSPIRLFRIMFFAIKSYICMGYYTREDVWQSIGYEGPFETDRPYIDPDIRAICKGRMEVIG